jgi:hypothetical protein
VCSRPKGPTRQLTKPAQPTNQTVHQAKSNMRYSMRYINSIISSCSGSAIFLYFVRHFWDFGMRCNDSFILLQWISHFATMTQSYFRFRQTFFLILSCATVTRSFLLQWLSPFFAIVTQSYFRFHESFFFEILLHSTVTQPFCCSDSVNFFYFVGQFFLFCQIFLIFQ